MEPIQVGLAGFGLAGKVFHAPFISAVPGLVLSSVLQRTGDTAATSYPTVQTLRTLSDLLSSRVSLIVVATPNATHYEIAKAALLAGKHVVVDKPAASTSAEAEELKSIAASAGLIFAPFHNRRWDGDFLTVKKLIEGGPLGRVVSMESHFDRFRPLQRLGSWKESGGDENSLLMDLGPHLIDQALALFGRPHGVWASLRKDRDVTAIEDAFDVFLHFEQHDRPITVTLRSTMIAAEPSPRFLVHGTHGSFRKFGVDPQEPALLAGASVPRIAENDTTDSWLQEDEAAWGTLALAADPAQPSQIHRSPIKTERSDYRGFYRNVRDAILGNAPLTVSPQDAIRTLRIIEMARQSSLTGNTVLTEGATW